MHKIMAHVHELFGCLPDQEVNIKVEYILVCPEDGSKHRWQMPDGWDGVGEALCIPLYTHSISLPHGASCQFIPNLTTYPNRGWI